MPWQNNEADEGDGAEAGKNAGGAGGNRPVNPWGEGPPRRPMGSKPQGRGEFDDLIRRSQERLKTQFGGGGPNGSGFSSDFSGVERVISTKSATDEPRRPGVVGLYLRMAMMFSPGP